VRKTGTKYQIANAIGCYASGKAATGFVDRSAPPICALITKKNQDITLVTDAHNLRGAAITTFPGALNNIFVQVKIHKGGHVYGVGRPYDAIPTGIAGYRAGHSAKHR
jgi:hypothetical protein